MSFEQPIYSFSYPSGEPPTPGLTPKSATFGKTSLGTPRFESSFYDPRLSPAGTSTFTASPEFLKTPKNLSFSTPVQSPVLSRGTKRPFPEHDLETAIASHVHHLSPNPNLPLPPVEPSRQLSSSPNPSASSANQTDNLASTGNTTPIETVLDQELGSSMKSASSIQTPPPTGTSITKKKAQLAQTAKLANETTGSGRRKSTAIYPKPQNAAISQSPVQPSPQPFPNIQFSPDTLGTFSMAGPATAPVYPQNKLFWDPSQHDDSMNIDFTTNDAFSDAFGLGLSKPMDSFISTDEPMTMSQITSSSFDVDNLMSTTMPQSTPSASQPHYLSSAGLINGSQSRSNDNVVNPSLLFSSPSKAPQQVKLDPAIQRYDNENLRPYAHQIMDAQREKESSQHRKPKRRRGPESDSPAVKAALDVLRDEDKDRMSVQRSFRDSIQATSSRQHSQSKRVSLDHTKHDTLSRSRRDKYQRPHEQSQKPAGRTAIELTIGPDGRAKTHTKLVAPEMAQATADLGSDSEDTESLSSEDEDQMVISRPSSFAYPTQKISKPKASRFNTGSNAHSQRSSYASTLGSNHSEKVPHRSGSFKRRPSSGLALNVEVATQSRSSGLDPALTTSFISGPLLSSQGAESETETVIESDDDRGDAQSELKKIVKDRAQRRASAQMSMSESFDGRQNTSSNHAPFPSQQTLTTPTQDLFSNISPTTITDPDLATPSTGGNSQAGTGTRCVCHNVNSDGEFMIMCESCRKWLHIRCTGLNPQKLPKVYLCVFCTGKTPTVRGGRAREPARAAFPPPSSPLARKGHRFR